MNKIKSKDGLNVLIEHKGVQENSRIFCDGIDYIKDRNENIFDHHLMFWLNGKLVFKVWLPNNPKDKEFKDIYEAMESVGINVLK